ncbi:hypothetical protein Q0M68_13780, partial [Staphylococcus aureus]|nr:hypothetical protein [Staphylococcus aureus]
PTMPAPPAAASRCEGHANRSGASVRHQRYVPLAYRPDGEASTSALVPIGRRMGCVPRQSPAWR